MLESNVLNLYPGLDDIENILAEGINALELDPDEVARLGTKAKPQLVNQDFNLNSPLIADEGDEVLHYIQRGNISERFSHRKEEANAVKTALYKLKFDPNELLSSKDHHTKLPQLIYSQQDSLVKADILERWETIWSATSEPAILTDKALTNTEQPNDYRRRFNLLKSLHPGLKSLQSEWICFLNTHFLTYVMNSPPGSSNKDWVPKLMHCQTWKKLEDWDIYVFGQDMTKPEWLLSPHFCVHLPTKTFFTKNFLLMIKDVSLARLMSKLALTYRIEPKRNNQDYHTKLEMLYKYGDKILTKYGNRGYKVIKLLEAVCTERWNQLGNAYRPNIPLSKELREHINKTINENTPMSLDAHLMFDLVFEENDPWLIGQMYGAFRHWGHPYINYLEGLKKLEERVNEQIMVDKVYANILASDLAFIVLKDQFKKKKRWFATAEHLSPDHPVRACIDQGVWPTSKVIEDFGPHWHRLNLLQCFDVPDTVELSELYSDKAHSMTRDKVIDHIIHKPNTPIPGLRVLDTLLNADALNLPAFLKSVDEHGLDWKDKCIGLKAKERELKDEGRFFALMTEKMRLLMVSTELLINRYFVPLFSGLTMADDLNTVTKKLLSATEGQGLSNYEKIYIANGLDYDKWNNRQRYESNHPVFLVMDKFLGYERVISRTHEIFQTSLIYYNDRPDLMEVIGRTVRNRFKDTKVCWEGQLGGFEGLRQKGWSVLNYLVLRREALTRNTKTKFLAQGDNQIVITQYSLTSKESSEIINREIQAIWENNKSIMLNICNATKRLGLQINHDEVITSSELLIYGKTPVFRGKVIPLETKRWSRVSSVTNDQIPSFSTSLASTTTSALAVNQFSDNPIEVIYQHHFFASFTASLLLTLNPILGLDPIGFDTIDKLCRKRFLLRLIYKDPSLGGVCGTNLLRFFISRFPDPLTESLTWWKLIHDESSSEEFKILCREMGNPKYGLLNVKTRSMLLEDPTSLNIPGGLSCNTMIKEKVYEGLQERVYTHNLKNPLIREAVLYTDQYKDNFVRWLFTIHPVFPRFISEFYTSTFFKITEGVLSIFENSRTMRKSFSHNFPTEVLTVIQKGEAMSIKSLLQPSLGFVFQPMWDCSASQADKMRKFSWGPELIGVTVPHPAEFLIEDECYAGCKEPHVVAKKVPLWQREEWTKGFMTPYLGSKTKETTSILQPWEKQMEVPLLKRACDLRKVIKWFVEPDSNLGKSIYGNLFSLCGLDLSEELVDYRRTGSSKHRLRCSRVSNEGNPAIGYNNLTYVTVTTDALAALNEENHDFMYQSLLCWAGVIAVLPSSCYVDSEATHFHIRCQGCIREIQEEILDSESIFNFPNKSAIIKRMVAQDIEMKYLPRYTRPQPLDWKDIAPENQSWHLGRAQGFLWGVAVYSGSVDEATTTLFPTTITRKVMPMQYMEGIHRGLCLGAALTPVYTRYGSLSDKARLKFEGSLYDLCKLALTRTNLPNMVNHSRFNSFLARTGGDVIKSYPATSLETTGVLQRWILHKLIQDRYNQVVWQPIPVVIFAEMNTEYIIGLFRIAESIYPIFQHDKLSSSQLRTLKEAMHAMKLLSLYNEARISSHELEELKTIMQSIKYTGYSLVTSEARHAAGFIKFRPLEEAIQLINPNYIEFGGLGGTEIVCDYIPTDNYKHVIIHNDLEVPRIRCTLFSSIRIAQFSTGAHYKYKDITRYFPLKGDGIFCGDGSGGIGANHLRKNLDARVIFNSKLDLQGDSLKGLAPGGPGAYTLSGEEVIKRCVNYSTCWEEPSDLSDNQTWIGFLSLIRKFDLNIRILCCDAEVQSVTITRKIENLIIYYIDKIFQVNKGTLIYKSYWNFAYKPQSLLNKIGFYFKNISVFLPTTQGSFTSELYIIARHRRDILSPALTLVTLPSLIDIYNNLKVNQSYGEEFNRALKLNLAIASEGLEDRVPYQSLEDIALFLVSVGLDTGFALFVSEHLARECHQGLHPISLMWILGYVISRHIFPVTSWFTPHTKMPSSHKLQKLMAGLFGIWQGLAFVTRDIETFKFLTDEYQTEKSISMGLSKRYSTKSKHKSGRFMSWRIGPGRNCKIVDPGPKAGITQQMTRLIYLLYQGHPYRREIEVDDIVKCDNILKNFDKGVSVTVLSMRTGINLLNYYKPNPEEIETELQDEEPEMGEHTADNHIDD